MNTKDDKLLGLVEQKAFTELSGDERAFVLDCISEEEYSLRRKVLHVSTEIIEEESTFLSPDLRIANKLREAMVGTKQKLSVLEHFSKFLKQPIPVYQMAAVLVGLLVLFFWKSNTGPAEVIYQDKIVVLEKYDTVYIDIPVVEIQIVEKAVKVVEYAVQDQKAPTRKNKEPYLSDKEKMKEATAKSNAFVFTDEQIEHHMEKSFGNTGMEIRELAQLIGVLN